MASDELAKSVSRKLKYYFQVKRLEDSFDLSGSHVPVLDHPPRICGPIVHYPSVYDRSLKHYFSHPEARVQLTQFKSPLDQGDSLEKMGKIMTKEDRIRNMVEKYLRRYNFSPQPVPLQAFVQTKKGFRLRPELRGMRGPYRTAGRRAKGFHGAYPVLRMTPNSDISKQEGNRLVNTATRLLLATQTVDLSSNNYDTTASGSKLQYLPNSQKAQAAERRRQIRSGGRSADRSSGRASGSSSVKRQTSSDRSSRDRGHMPTWLRKEISRLADEESTRGGSHDQSPYVRAYSAPTPPKGERSSSNGSVRRRSLRRRTIGDGSENIATQTERRTTDPDDQTSLPIEDKDHVIYEVLVTTGNHIGASTTADVYLTLFGSLGRSPEIQLVNSKTHRLMFRKGQTDEFSITLPYVGSLKRLQIGHNSHESGSDWYLESVLVTDPRANQRLLFKCNRWMSAREEDSLTKRVLFPDQNSPPLSSATAPKLDESKPKDDGRNSPSSASSSVSSTISGEDEKQSARSRSDSESSTEATVSSTGYAKRAADRESSESLYTDETSDEETAKEEEVEALYSDEEESGIERESDEGASKSQEELRSDRMSSLNPIEEEQALESARSSSVASSRVSQSSEQPGPVSPDEEDNEMERVEVEQEATELDFDYKRNVPVKSIHQAVEDGELTQVIDIVLNNRSNANNPDERGFMPLHIACERGHRDIVKWLCDNGASIDAETPTGYGPLHLATLEGHLDCMKTLSELGVDLNSTTTDGQTALHIAAKNAHLDVVKWLVGEGADVNAEDLGGMKAVAWATQYGHAEVVQYLLEVSGDKSDGAEEFPASVTPPPVRVIPKRISRRLTEESLLQEKRKSYQKQMDNMSTSSSTFLDAIRNETTENADNVRE